MKLSLPNIYRPQRSCGQGYVFTRVCDSVNRGVSREPPPGTRQTPPTDKNPPKTKENPLPGPGIPPQDQGEPPGTKENPSPPGRTLQHTVNERPVPIRLECILVCSSGFSVETVDNRILIPLKSLKLITCYGCEFPQLEINFYIWRQEYIPVGCVPPAAVVVSPATHAPPGHAPLGMHTPGTHAPPPEQNDRRL